MSCSFFPPWADGALHPSPARVSQPIEPPLLPSQVKTFIPSPSLRPLSVPTAWRSQGQVGLPLTCSGPRCEAKSGKNSDGIVYGLHDQVIVSLGILSSSPRKVESICPSLSLDWSSAMDRLPFFPNQGSRQSALRLHGFLIYESVNLRYGLTTFPRDLARSRVSLGTLSNSAWCSGERM
ncbi:hypothetical protein BO82DRAFT_206608 [Aspergillus uvarum CBS 121591]|uniref:Uncharacterized protein n=1 Tax=Aspergillus uvarum CBS 121591 TaxID=1448315 RepID=A0A319CLW8_9EURO|nr:hypothetical protein BO82DRAFT_206608 [Aspergillus uvarum CBS 121591]PYH76448.1 hypothetical protein BO82DRAFT_206608 [Aspergillus uvarum CBS 121591]